MYKMRRLKYMDIASDGCYSCVMDAAQEDLDNEK